jgi:myo-inositol-1(or 4)-monophosphatase
MTDFLEVAVEVSGEASALLRNRFESELDIERKGNFDMVTEADRSCERLIVDRLHRSFPNHSIVGEEGTHIRGDEDLCWLIDPLDGTANFVHKLPFFAVSIALIQDGQPIMGVISNPVRDECFAAERGSGTRLNGAPSKVSTISRVSESLLATVFPAHARESNGNIHYYHQLDSVSHGVRRSGSAALELAYVACGRLDALWGFGLKPWDYAAGLLFVREAGGVITDMLGQRADLNSQHLLADNGLLHDQLLTALAEVSKGSSRSMPSPQIR